MPDALATPTQRTDPASPCDARLLSRSLAGYLCGTHSGALRRRRGDRLAAAQLGDAHARLALAPGSDALHLGLEPWRPAAGAQRLAAQLREQLDVPGIVDLVVFGSQARGSTTRYSDIDAILVVDDDVPRRPAALRALRGRVMRAQRHVLEFQPLQHHGFEVATPALLRDTVGALALPAEALAETATLFGRRLPHAACAPISRDEACRRFHAFAAQLLLVRDWPRHPWSLHATISRFALAPALYAQAVGERVPKWRSFEVGRQRLGTAWAPYETLREVREGWPEVHPGVLAPMLRAVSNPWLAVDAWRRLPVAAPAPSSGALSLETLHRLHAVVALMQADVQLP